jgi:hypothetical protein
LTTTKENVCQRPEEPMSKSLPSLATGILGMYGCTSLFHKITGDRRRCL